VAALKVDRHRHRSGRVGAVGIRRRFAGTITAVDHGVVTMAVRGRDRRWLPRARADDLATICAALRIATVVRRRGFVRRPGWRWLVAVSWVATVGGRVVGGDGCGRAAGGDG
jgi:hypothetical protein